MFVFLAVLARVSGMLLIAPLFGARIMPVRVRAGVAFGLAVAVFPAAVMATPVPPTSPLGVGVALGLEVSAGYTIGLAATLLFAAVRTSGQLAGIHMGIGIANLVDPQTMEHITPIAEWFNMTAMLLFLGLDGHHILIRGLARSFELLPAGLGIASIKGMSTVVVAAGSMFSTSVQLAAPVLVILLLTNGVMGVLARMIPQLNVFIVGFPINLLAALFVLGVAHPFIVNFIVSEIGGMERLLETVIVNMR